MIEEIYTAKWFNEAIEKTKPIELQDDLKHEVILHLCIMPTEKLESIVSSGGIKFYTVRVMMNMIQSSTSKFFRMFRNYQEIGDINDINEINEINETYIEPLPIDLDCIFGNTREELYEKDMLRIYTYQFKCNALELSRSVGIPYKSINRTLQNAKNKVKCYLKQQQQ